MGITAYSSLWIMPALYHDNPKPLNPKPARSNTEPEGAVRLLQTNSSLQRPKKNSTPNPNSWTPNTLIPTPKTLNLEHKTLNPNPEPKKTLTHGKKKHIRANRRGSRPTGKPAQMQSSKSWVSTNLVVRSRVVGLGGFRV